MTLNGLQERRLGITARTALLSWLVTTITLSTFVLVIIPQQKRTFLENLDSKAHGVAVSLRDVAASAVVNEDYSSVVDHCMQMLRGDSSIDHLVITRSDGFCLIHDRERWYSETNSAPEWRPKVRERTSAISVVPGLQRRVFHYAQPFDYSGIQWGWIHVGLSLEGYDRSVSSAYRRTIVLAALCTALSLLASLLHATRLVRPILNLRTVVQQVASGDLSAHAAIESGDEVGSLARSFNSMTNALLLRDAILQSVRFAAQQFLRAADWQSVIDQVLARIGSAARVSRIHVFQHGEPSATQPVSFRRFEWTDPAVAAQPLLPELNQLPWQSSGLTAWLDQLAKGEIVSAVVSTSLPAERTFLQAQGIRSLMLVPIRGEDGAWGFLGLEHRVSEQRWNDAERDSMRAAADMLSATIARQRARDALLEAKQNLELRVSERTRELQEQVVAKERARAELAEAQQRLMDLSREAGMAEVATGVLHNVGNILNSVNISINVLQTRLARSKLGSLSQAAALLREHRANLHGFLNQHPKGQLIPEFIIRIADHLEAELQSWKTELLELARNSDHISEIVAMQQTYARVAGIVESISPESLVEDALRLNQAGLLRRGVQIFREFADTPPIMVDKHTALQILVNLIRNSRDSLEECTAPDKRLTVIIRQHSLHRIQIIVEDNGVGIAPENLTRIFAHGFTTKQHGHGFGLHSGALAARRLGGSLTAFSAGSGCGARFTLELPAAGIGANLQSTPLPAPFSGYISEGI